VTICNRVYQVRAVGWSCAPLRIVAPCPEIEHSLGTTTDMAVHRTSPPAHSHFAGVAPLVGLAAFVLLWQLLSLAYPEFILPGPLAVARAIVERSADGTLTRHTLITLSEAVPGLLMGLLAALALGYPIAHSRLAERLLSPILVASQGIPLVAVAPLLFIWFGNGYGAKILVCTLIVFFPILINVISGLRSVPRALDDLFRLHNAGRWARFTKLELPAALPFLFAGLRTGGTLSMIGALTGEFISPTQGLGFFINLAYGQYDTPVVMAGIVATVASALLIYAAVRFVERAVVRL
jgi:NitT/TauT family transport system permease protein